MLKFYFLGCSLFLLASCVNKIASRVPDIAYAVKTLSFDEAEIDSKLEEQYRDQLETLDPRYLETHYDILVFNRFMLIVGNVFDKSMRLTAKDAYQRISGDGRFSQYLPISAPIGMINSVLDSTTHTKFKYQLIAHSGIDASIVHSIVFDSRIYLMGFVTKAQALTIIDIASQTAGVNEVHALFDYVNLQGETIVVTH